MLCRWTWLSRTGESKRSGFARDVSEANDWLVRYARHVVRDAELASDLVQDALTTALEKPPLSRGSLRPWLTAVLRNRLREHARRTPPALGRSDVRSPDSPATLEVVEGRELSRSVRRAVAALREPYRTTARLRFLEGWSPGEIARRSGTSVKTVRTRIDRALPMLRLQLGRHAR